jgi:putative transposase
MTAPHIVDLNELLPQAAGDASPDLLWTLLNPINMLLAADADAVVGAEYGVPTDLPSVLGPVASRVAIGL